MMLLLRAWRLRKFFSLFLFDFSFTVMLWGRVGVERDVLRRD